MTPDEMRERSRLIGVLEMYSRFLEENGYMDVDWRTEEPFAIDEFMKDFNIEDLKPLEP